MKLRKISAVLTAGCLLFACAGCSSDNPWGAATSGQDPDHIEISLPEMQQETEPVAETSAETEPEPTQAEPNGETYILFTSDILCGADRGFGYAGLAQIRHNLEANGYNTILVDGGNALQGEPIGTFTEGGAITDIMNAAGYDVAVPAERDLDYGAERFAELELLSDFQYVCCNYPEDDAEFDPYAVISAGDTDIAFIGVMNDENAEASVQTSMEEIYEAGAGLVYVIGHAGAGDAQVVVFDAEGAETARIGIAPRFSNIGYSHISADGQVLETGVWTWDEDMSMPDLLGIDNEVSAVVADKTAELDEILDEVVAVNEAEDIESSCGDLCAEALRDQTGADIALLASDAVYASIGTTYVTYRDLVDAFPDCRGVCILEVTGQQILDLMEIEEDEPLFLMSPSDFDIEPGETYTVACTDAGIFEQSTVISGYVMPDYEALINYITVTLEGVIS